MKQDNLLRGWALKAYTVQNSRRLLFGTLAMTFLGVGCTKAAMYGTRLTPTDLAPEDAATVVLDQFSGEFSAAKEAKFVRCITKAIHKAHPTLKIVPPDVFRKAAFPGLTAEEIPQCATWEEVAKDPRFQERIAPLDLRYLIAVTGGTTQNTKFVIEGVPLYGGGMGFMGDIGDRRSSVHATVLDLERGKEVGSVDASAYNISRFGWLILPLPFYVPPPPTEARACEELGEGIAKFLAGEKLPEEEGIWPAMREEDLARPAPAPDCASASDPACW